MKKIFKSENKKRTEIFNIIKDNLETSTSHGIPNIVRNKNWIIKIIWTICFSVSFAYCVYNLTKSFEIYFSYETDTKVTNNRLASIDFPTITICNKNKFNLAKNANISNKMIELKNFYIENFIQLTPYSINVFDILSYNLFYDYLQNPYYFKEAGFELEQILLNCKFNSMICNKDNFGKVFSPLSGKCFTFNFKMPIKNSVYPGSEYGLKLELYTGLLDKNYDLIRSSGFLIFIHNSSIKQFDILNGINLPVGYETDIVISKEHSKKMPYPYSNCIEDISSNDSFDSELYRKTLKNNGIYQQRNCLITCVDEYIIQECGCNPIPIDIEQGCNMTMIFDCVAGKYSEFYNSSKATECQDFCPEECESIKYNYKTNYADFPSPFYSDILIKSNYLWSNNSWNNSTYEDVKKSVLAVNIFYDDISVKMIEESPSKTIDQLVADIGGFLGLCIGISILSIIELIELILRIFILVITKKNNVHSKDSLNI
ncbi:unnamed protein product [Brachionus calyciflorus]|uniref:Uncharacterized protein n=1 Tax=Brachionus calyciflorus TaxID=104777 RepID=A0A813SXJ7_9BILA|nr:unnamed protein product [Brachionus calyciflorus]